MLCIVFELFVYIKILCHEFFRFPVNLWYSGIVVYVVLNGEGRVFVVNELVMNQIS